MSVDLLSEALRLAVNGRPVFPVHPNTKKPLVQWGAVAKTPPDPAKITGWWEKWPDAGIALVTGGGLAVLDLDCKNGLDGIASLRALEQKFGSLPPTKTVVTPSGGRHLYFRTAHGCKIRNGTNLSLGLPDAPAKSGIDVRADGGYVLAPPSMIDGRRYTVAANEGEVADAPAWLIDFMQQGASALGDMPASTGSVRVTSQQIADLRGALTFHDPQDYHGWINAGQALRELGDAGFELWTEFGRRDNRFTIEEAREKWATFQPSGTGYPSIFKTAQRNGWRNPNKSAAFSPPIEEAGPDGGFVWGDVLTSAEHLKAAEWTVRRVIPAECTGLLVGAWGTCKTFLALDFAGCIANGKEWHGHATKQGTVFYLCGEGESGIARRLKAWEIANGGSVAGIAVRQMPDIRDAETLAQLMEAIDRLAVARGEPRLILIDTLFTALNGGNENSGQDMGEVFRAMRALRHRFRCAVIAVHHTGHDETRARGHSSMEAGVDVQLFLTNEKRAGASVLTLANKKQKDGAPFEPIMLTTEDVQLVGLTDDLGQIESSLVIRRPGDAQRAEYESMKTDMRLEDSKLPADRALRQEMMQKAKDLYGAGHTLQAICDSIYTQYGHRKHPPGITAWLQKLGVDTSRR